MALIYQSQPYVRSFILVSNNDHISPVLGAIPIVALAKGGVPPFTQANGAVSEVGNGWYEVSLTAVDTNILGDLDYHVTALNADNTDFTDQVVLAPTQPNPSGTGPFACDFTGFQNFVRNIMRISLAHLPANAPVIMYAFANALAIVNPQLRAVGACSCGGTSLFLGVAATPNGDSLYCQAVYHLAADNLINYAMDQPGFRYFQNLRKKLNINGFVSGLIQSSSDESSSVSLVVQDAAKQFTMRDLQNLKSPYGRAYLGFAQAAGPTTWGLT